MVRDPRKLGYPSVGTGRFDVRGDLHCESSAIPKGWHSGQLEELAYRHRRKMRRSGRLDHPSPVKPEMQDEGKPKSYIGGAAGGRQATGKLETWLKPSIAEGMKFGVTRTFIAGTAEGPKPRGNPRHRTPAQEKGSAEGATRKRNPV